MDDLFQAAPEAMPVTTLVAVVPTTNAMLEDAHDGSLFLALRASILPKSESPPRQSVCTFSESLGSAFAQVSICSLPLPFRNMRGSTNHTLGRQRTVRMQCLPCTFKFGC